MDERLKRKKLITLSIGALLIVSVLFIEFVLFDSNWGSAFRVRRDFIQKLEAGKVEVYNRWNGVTPYGEPICALCGSPMGDHNLFGDRKDPNYIPSYSC